MGKVILDMAMSLDGFIAAKPGSYIYPIEDIRDTKRLQKLIKKAGAVIMDLAAYKLAKGNFTDYEYQVPLFIVTKKVPAIKAKGENENLKIIFETKGIKRAIVNAKKIARDKNVMIIGLVDSAQQAIHGNMVDELIIRIVPELLGKGVRLFDKLGEKKRRLSIAGLKQYHQWVDLYFRIK